MIRLWNFKVKKYLPLSAFFLLFGIYGVMFFSSTKLNWDSRILDIFLYIVLYPITFLFFALIGGLLYYGIFLGTLYLKSAWQNKSLDSENISFASNWVFYSLLFTIFLFSWVALNFPGYFFNDYFFKLLGIGILIWVGAFLLIRRLRRKEISIQQIQTPPKEEFIYIESDEEQKRKLIEEIPYIPSEIMEDRIRNAIKSLEQEMLKRREKAERIVRRCALKKLNEREEKLSDSGS